MTANDLTTALPACAAGLRPSKPASPCHQQRHPNGPPSTVTPLRPRSAKFRRVGPAAQASDDPRPPTGRERQ